MGKGVAFVIYLGDAKRIMDENGRDKTLCFTGHRAVPDCDMDKVIKRTDALIERSVEDGYRVFLAGGAVGFDTIAAFRVLSARNRFKNIKLVLVLPCKNQTAKWKTEKSVHEYQMLKNSADGVIILQEFYDEGCMLKRNRFMVDNSGKLICYLTRNKGGSAYTVGYAQKSGIDCVNVGTDG